jgi:steroid 5-alpha reductase family enzyme
MGTLLLIAVQIIFIHATIWYFIALGLKRNDVADIAWGLGFLWIVLYATAAFPVSPFNFLVYTCTGLWALRLSIHIGIRSYKKKEEDFRYRQWRKEWGTTFYWRTYLQVFLLQGLFQFIIALPILVAANSGHNYLAFLLMPAQSDAIFSAPNTENTMIAGSLVWITGFLFQTIGDFQLTRFAKTKQPGQIMQTGLWKYSRHPNYFGEIAMWWGIWLMVATLPYGIWAIISPLTITYLLAFVSGVPMLEKKYAGNLQFENYKQNTNALIPWFPKKEKT